MTNLRLNRDTKVFVFFRNEIVKRNRKFRVQKINKDKIFASRDSSMLKKSRAFALECESQFESKSQSESKSQRFVIDSFIFVSIVFVLIDNATLLKMFF
jgi:NADH:ubiquinone oxidoreductase subunit 3 (subunit A)